MGNSIKHLVFYDTFEDDDVRKTMLIDEYTGTAELFITGVTAGTNMDLGPIPLKINFDLERAQLTTVDIIQDHIVKLNGS